MMGDLYGALRDVAPYWMWGLLGVAIGMSRVIALVRNGHWRPSPELRLLGAIYGAMFWVAVSYCYHISVSSGAAPDFPMRRAMLVLIVFEVLAAYRCGHDIGIRARSEAMQKAS